MLNVLLLARYSRPLLLTLFALPPLAGAETHFIEAESFAPSEG